VSADDRENWGALARRVSYGIKVIDEGNGGRVEIDVFDGIQRIGAVVGNIPGSGIDAVVKPGVRISQRVLPAPRRCDADSGLDAVVDPIDVGRENSAHRCAEHAEFLRVDPQGVSWKVREFLEQRESTHS